MVERVGVTCLQADALKTVVAEVFALDIDVVVHGTVDSTNNWALRQCRAGKVLPFACFAENQTAGKGRRGKQWLMIAGSNIAMSLCWPYVVSQQLQLLSLSVALGVVRTLEAFDLQHVQIKWPNDIYVHGKKIAGILIETRPVKSAPAGAAATESTETAQVAVVIGVGLNYDMSAFDSMRGQSLAADFLPDMTDLLREVSGPCVGQKIERQRVAEVLLKNVIGVCQRFQFDALQNLAEFRARYDFCKNKTVNILQNDGLTLSGIALGINDAAELRVMIDGKECVFNSAEVSVKAGLK